MHDPALPFRLPAYRFTRLVMLLALTICLSSHCLSAASESTRGTQHLDIRQGDIKYALLIGINRYQDARLPELEFAVNDAEKLAGVLRGMGYRVAMLTTDQPGTNQPTRENVVREFKELANRVTPNDTLFFFFAGHGFSMQGKGSYLATLDTDLARAEETAVSVSVLGKLTEKISCRQAALVFDACRTSVRSVVADGTGALPETLAADVRNLGEKERGTAVLFACRAGQFARETTEKQQGLFSYYLVRGFQGEAVSANGEVTLSRLMDFAQMSVESSSRRKQQPWLNFNGARMILGEVKRPAPAPAPSDSLPALSPSTSETELLVNLRPSGGTFRKGDAAVRGGTLKGSLSFGTGSPVTFPLNRNYHYFEVTVGVDVKTKEDAAVQFRVEGDGAPLGEPVMLTVHSKPQTLSIDVSKVDQLRLIVAGSSSGRTRTFSPGTAWWGRAAVIRDAGTAIAKTTETEPAISAKRMIYLSALSPVRGHAVGGLALLKGRDIPNSVTMGSADSSEPVYALNGQYDTFQATLGLERNTQEKYGVMFVLEADGRPLRSFGPFNVNHPPVDTGAISVKGVDQLKLKVEPLIPGNEGSRRGTLSSGHTWWGAARLEQSEAAH